MIKAFSLKDQTSLWQFIFILSSSLWLLAPYLNHFLSSRTSLISQYEVPTQPYSMLFRLGDVIGGLLLVGAGMYIARAQGQKLIGWMIMIIGLGTSLDPIFTTNCNVVGTQCVEYFSLNFVLHAAETVITTSTIFLLSLYDAYKRQRLLSISFVVAQVFYFGLFITQYTTHAQFNTLSQFIYQLVIVIWLAWLIREKAQPLPTAKRWSSKTVKYLFAGWAFINGLLTIAVSFAHINVHGRLNGLYFARDNAWLAQHTIVAGLLMLYLSRHLARGEMRARQIFLIITGVESLKYSVLTPNIWLLLIYSLTFSLLFIARDSFDIGTVPLAWRMRIKDSLFMLGSVLVAALLSLLVLDHDDRASIIAERTFDHFEDYFWTNKPHGHLASVLLAHTLSVFIATSLVLVLWILFKPGKVRPAPSDKSKLKDFLSQYSLTAEDYFKLGPDDRQYFWASGSRGFVAYKTVGSICFALADPISSKSARAKVLKEFIAWARANRLKVCFLPVYENSLIMYEKAGLKTLMIGSSAVVNIGQFLNDTSADKWWRWQKNRAIKSGYEHKVSSPPHSRALFKQFKNVSDAWLTIGDHKERGFALGYYDEAYLNQCKIHYLCDVHGKVIAFVNGLPEFKKIDTATIDLLRYKPDFNNSMPYLLYSTISDLSGEYKFFDLGFVPFAKVKNPALSIARVISANRFSAKGLEQFKNKFRPDWQPNYMAYDGDLADLAVIALRLEAVMDEH